MYMTYIMYVKLNNDYKTILCNRYQVKKQHFQNLEAILLCVISIINLSPITVSDFCDNNFFLIFSLAFP